jgi:uncharacterized protein (UPF0248 family)
MKKLDLLWDPAAAIAWMSVAFRSRYEAGSSATSSAVGHAPTRFRVLSIRAQSNRKVWNKGDNWLSDGMGTPNASLHRATDDLPSCFPTAAAACGGIKGPK